MDPASGGSGADFDRLRPFGMLPEKPKNTNLVRERLMITFKKVLLLMSAAVLISGAIPCRAAQPASQGCPVTNGDLAKVGEITKMVFIHQWSKPEAQFQEDKDPGTLEVVVLSGPKDGPNAVSSDGQVLFQQENASGAIVEKLLVRAFYIRFVLANHLTALCKGPWNR